MSNIEETVTKGKSTFAQQLKTRIYDIIALAIMLALFLLSLGALGIKEITWDTIADIVMNFTPMYLSIVLLSTNYYNKGVFTAKATEEFKNIVNAYSNLVDSFTGKEISGLYDFCRKYNEDALKNAQTIILREMCISYEEFAVGTEDKPPLKTLLNKELKDTYGKEFAKVVIKAKKIKLKGLNVNLLLGSDNTIDDTDLGKNEKQLRIKEKGMLVFNYFFTIAILSLITVKNVLEWGWYGVAVILFQIIYIFCKSYLCYFDGYTDIRTHLSNHISRKIDILKQYKNTL